MEVGRERGKPTSISKREGEMGDICNSVNSKKLKKTHTQRAR